jgi:tetratricopeptide (TPR) repeat protein
LPWMFILLLLVLTVWFLVLPQYDLVNAKQYMDTGQYEKARKAYQKVLAQSWFASHTAQLGLEKASVFEAPDREFHKDIIRQRIDQILAQYPDDPHAYLFLGDLYAAERDYTQASYYYEGAITRDPKLAHGYFSLGVVYDKLGKREQALERSRRAVELTGWYQPYLINLAYQLRNQDYVEALATYERALKLDRNFLLIYFDIAYCLRALGQLEQALRYLQIGVDLIDTPQITRQEKNQMPWYFILDTQELPLDTLPRKQCYAYRSLAAILQALHRPEAQRYEQKPCALDRSEEHFIQEWVEAENRRIGSAR